MKRAKSFERLVRRAALARLKASPKQWDAYRRSNPSWLQWCVSKAMIVIGFWTAGVMLIGLPMRAGVGIGNGGRDVAFMGTIAVLIASSMALGHARWLLQEIVASRALAIVSQLPIADAEFLSHRLRRMLFMSLTSLAATLAYFFGIAVGARLPLGRSLVTVGLGLIEWLIIISVAVVVPAYFPFMQRPRVVRMLWGVTLISLVGGVIAGMRELLPIETVVSWLLGVIPTGWPLLMVAYGVMTPGRAIWFFLVPIAVLLVLGMLAVQRMKAKYRLLEINFSEGTFASAVLQTNADPLQLPTFAIDEQNEQTEVTLVDDDPTNDGGSFSDTLSNEDEVAPRRPSKIAWRWFQSRAAESEPVLVERDAEACRELIRSRAFLEADPWPQSGWFESSFLNIVDDRERHVAELSVGNRADWSPRSKKVVFPFVMLGLTALANGAIKQMVPLLGFLIAISWIITVGTRSWPSIVWKSKSGQQVSIAALLPIKPHEIMRLSIKLGIVRAGYLAPFIFGVAATAIFGARGRWDFARAFMFTAKIVLLVVAVHQWSMISTLPTTSSRNWRQQFRYVVVTTLCFLGAMGSGIALLAAGRSEIRSLVAAMLLIGSGWLAQWFEQLAINRGPVDFVTTSESDAFKNRREHETPELNWS